MHFQSSKARKVLVVSGYDKYLCVGGLVQFTPVTNYICKIIHIIFSHIPIGNRDEEITTGVTENQQDGCV